MPIYKPSLHHEKNNLMAKSLQQYDLLLPSIKGGLNKAQISSLIKQSIDRVLEQGNVFEVVEAVSVMEEFIKGVRKDEGFVDYLREELSKYQGKYTTKAGAKIEICEVGIIYDYSNDLRWLELEQQIDNLMEQQKKVGRKASPDSSR